MKKIAMIAVAICAICLLAVPAMAVDVDFSGSYRIQGVYHEHSDLTDESSSDAWFDQRFRLKTTFKVSDNLSLVTRFDALDGKKWGKNIYDDNEFDANVSWDAAYMVIKTPIGGFLAGRFPTTWEDTGWADSEGNRERIYYVLPIGNFQAALVYEKWYEFDSEGDPIKETFSAVAEGINNSPLGPTLDALGLSWKTYDGWDDDADNDKYLYSLSYKSGNMKYTLAGGYYRVQVLQDFGGHQSWNALMENLQALTGSDQLNYQVGTPLEGDAILWNPSIRGSFGGFSFDFEGTYASGSGSYDYANLLINQYNNTAELLLASAPAGTFEAFYELDEIEDVDIEVYCFNGEVRYNVGGFEFQAGFATFSGDDMNGDDDEKFTGYGLFENNSGWEKTFLLFGAEDTNGINESLGGLGNLASEATSPYSPALINGFQAWYFGIDYNVLDNLKLGFLYLTSKADEVKDTDDQIIPIVTGAATGEAVIIPGEKWDDDHGDEYNFTLTWDIYENLQYKFIAAYLDAGDYWQQGDPDADVEDTYSLFHRLTLSF